MATTFAGKIIITFFMSMVPVIELRGALPSGVAMGLSPWVAFAVSVIGRTPFTGRMLPSRLSSMLFRQLSSADSN